MYQKIIQSETIVDRQKCITVGRVLGNCARTLKITETAVGVNRKQTRSHDYAALKLTEITVASGFAKLKQTPGILHGIARVIPVHVIESHCLEHLLVIGIGFKRLKILLDCIFPCINRVGTKHTWHSQQHCQNKKYVQKLCFHFSRGLSFSIHPVCVLPLAKLQFSTVTAS